MKKLLMATAATALTAGTAYAQDAESVPLGILLSFTGPIESLTPAMGSGAEMAISEVSENENFLGGAL